MLFSNSESTTVLAITRFQGHDPASTNTNAAIVLPELTRTQVNESDTESDRIGSDQPTKSYRNPGCGPTNGPDGRSLFSYFSTISFFFQY